MRRHEIDDSTLGENFVPVGKKYIEFKRPVELETRSIVGRWIERAGNFEPSMSLVTAPKPATAGLAAAETITVKVDGKSASVPKTTPDPITGKPIPTTMIQACAIAKVDVPHYCYHPKLPVAGNCRMCLVEFGTPALGLDRKPLLHTDGALKINKSPRPAIACASPVSPGMEIYTNTPSVKQMREGVPDLRSSGRMQAPGILGGLRPIGYAVRRGEGSQAQAR